MIPHESLTLDEARAWLLASAADIIAAAEEVDYTIVTPEATS